MPGRMSDHIDKVSQEPEEMLPQNRTSTSGPMGYMARHDESRRHKEARPKQAVHDLHRASRFERRKGEQQQKRRHELRPNEKGQPHKCHAGSPELDDRRDEIHRAEQGRGDYSPCANPEGLPVQEEIVQRAQVRNARKRRVRGPARFRRAAHDKERDHHEDATDEEAPEARHIDPRESHVGRADLQRHHEIAEGREGHRHNAEEHHDRAVHGAERIIAVRRQHAFQPVLVRPKGAVTENRLQQPANHRHVLSWVRELPAHDHHQAETEQEEYQPRRPILNADHLVIGGEDPLLPETGLVMVIVVMIVVGVVR